MVRMKNKTLIVVIIVLILATGFIGRRFQKEAEIPKTTNLSQVKVAILYERIGDGKIIGRGIEDEIKIFKELKVDFILRAFWRWSPCPQKCEDVKDEKKRKICEIRGYSYENLEKTISKIKSEIPEIIICGAVPVQIIQRNFIWNPKTNEIIKYPETRDLALDPQKWGINCSKEKLQCNFAKTHFWIPRDLACSLYNPKEAAAYFPDLTNKKYQHCF